jgi:poly(3-hydroxybutyrate) depolymerase
MKSLAVLLFLSLGWGVAWAEEAAPAADAGRSEFVFARGGLHVEVRYYVPPGAASNSPVVFVMHGMKRNGETYLDEWMPYADQCHFVLVVPEFSELEFPGSRGYQDGNLFTAQGQPNGRDKWTYTMIEPIFDEVRHRSGNTSEQYSIYGHSAGAQFVNRFIAFVPQARVIRAVSANAGSYLMPDAGQAFPFGFGHSGLGGDDLRAFLGKPLVVLLGTADNDPNHSELSHAPGAEAQGPHRLARGNFFFTSGQKEAAALDTPFGWTLSLAPDVAHSDKGMAPFAIKCLFPER